jgi:hypothetical protein
MKSTFKKFALALFMATLAITSAHAVTPPGQLVGTTDVVLQGGSNSSVKWRIPAASTFKVRVQVPMDGTATSALYHVYPKGNLAGSTACSSTDATYPCFEIPVNQAVNQGKWLQLTLNNKATTQWKFTKDGFVTVNASNLATTELLSLGLVAFEYMTLKIGKSYQGGIIFYLDSTGQHGLIAAKTDQSTGIQWYNSSYTTINATGTAIGTGKANTAAIIASQGTGIYAAKLCDDLVVGIYKDWYLPSKDELNLMYTNIGQGATNGGGFASGNYWSSSEYDGVSALGQSFANGDQDSYYKYGTLYVRAVRAF